MSRKRCPGLLREVEYGDGDTDIEVEMEGQGLSTGAWQNNDG